MPIIRRPVSPEGFRAAAEAGDAPFGGPRRTFSKKMAVCCQYANFQMECRPKKKPT